MQTDRITLRELTLRYTPRRDADGKRLTVRKRVSTAADAAEAFRSIMGDEPGEVFGILCLSTRNAVIGYHEVSRGTLDASLVHPREVFKAALLANAAGIILAHNHPSGDPTPSADDRILTDRLKAAGELLGVTVLDHIVVGDGAQVSMRELGRL